jgi:IS605 OrfB family transposase
VRLAKKLRYAIAREDLTGLINSLRKIKNKDHRTKLIIVGYKRLGKWIDWQAEKHGVPLAIVNPNGTSSECPQCGSKDLEEAGYRRLRCPRCGFKADRDVIGKLNIRKRKMMLWISKRIPKPKPYKPRDAIAVDINEKKIVYGDDRINKERDTEIGEAHRWKLLAESLQKKYSSARYPAWRRRRGILNRIRSYHRKAKNILEDWARKTSLRIVRLAKRLGYAVAREDLTGLIESLRDLPKITGKS